MQYFNNKDGGHILLKMSEEIQRNKEYLGEIDGLIGDGDHGMNMNKGFATYARRFSGELQSFTDGMQALGEILLNEIGGSMGPIYGTIFIGMAEASCKMEKISIKELAGIYLYAYEMLKEIIEAEPGDKTLVDTLDPAVKTLVEMKESGAELELGLSRMTEAATNGMESTKDMEARYGRSSRLGKRSCGVLDAGAVSCCILIEAISQGILDIMKEE